MATEPERATIFVLDDDESVRKALARLIRTAGMSAVKCVSVDELLGSPALSDCDCIVADIRMPDASGLALPGLLSESGLATPIIFVSACDTPVVRAEAKRAGAAGFFRKPVDDQALLDAIAWAIRNERVTNHA